MANNKFSLTTAVDIRNPSAIIFRHAHDGPSALGGFAIWMFYDSSQQVAPQIVDDELSQLGVSTFFVVNLASQSLELAIYKNLVYANMVSEGEIE